MLTEQDLISIGILRRTHQRDLPPFVFVKRDGLFVPFRSERIAELMGEEIYLLRADLADDSDDTLTWQDLVGFTVLDEETTIGVIDSIDESTINTLAILTDGRMLPLHEDFILDIDTDQRLIRLRLPFAI